MPARPNTDPIPADASELNPRLTKAEEQRVRQQFAADQRALGEGMPRQLGVTADDAVRQARPEDVPPAASAPTIDPGAVGEALGRSYV